MRKVKSFKKPIVIAQVMMADVSSVIPSSIQVKNFFHQFISSTEPRNCSQTFVVVVVVLCATIEGKWYVFLFLLTSSTNCTCAHFASRKHDSHKLQRHLTVSFNELFLVPTGAPRDVRIRASSPTTLVIEWAVSLVPVFIRCLYVFVVTAMITAVMHSVQQHDNHTKKHGRL